MTKKIKTGIIGLGCRGFSLLDTILACENAEIAAVCDVYPDRIDRAFEKICKKRKSSLQNISIIANCLPTEK